MSRHDRSRMSMNELITEAERREIAGAEWMDRAALLRALDERDTESPVGALARARRFLGQVTGLGRVAKVVRSAVDPVRPAAPTLVVERANVVMVIESASVSEAASVSAPVVEIDAPAPLVIELPPPRASELLAGDPSFGGMRVVHRDGRGWIVWRASSSRLAAIGRGNELTLRLVSIGCAIGEPHADVVVETADELGLELEGVRALPEARGRPCVAAIGVGRGDGFVAVAHARVA